MKLLKYPESSLQNGRNKYFYHPTKQKKLLVYTGSSLRIWKNKYFYYSTRHKRDSFNILGLLCRIEKNGFIILLRKKNLLKYPGSSFQNWKKCAKESLVKITWWNLLEYSGSSEQNQEIFLGYCFHQKSKKLQCCKPTAP